MSNAERKEGFSNERSEVTRRVHVYDFLLYPPPPLQFAYSAWVGALAHEGATRVEGILNQKYSGLCA